MTASPSERIPRSPWRAFWELSTTDVEPVELSVAAILWPIFPDFPIPTTTIFPLFSRVSLRSSTARSNSLFRLDATRLSSSISISKMRRPRSA